MSGDNPENPKQCHGLTIEGKRCRKTPADGDYCEIHRDQATTIFAMRQYLLSQKKGDLDLYVERHKDQLKTFEYKIKERVWADLTGKIKFLSWLWALVCAALVTSVVTYAFNTVSEGLIKAAADQIASDETVVKRVVEANTVLGEKAKEAAEDASKTAKAAGKTADETEVEAKKLRAEIQEVRQRLQNIEIDTLRNLGPRITKLKEMLDQLIIEAKKEGGQIND